MPVELVSASDFEIGEASVDAGEVLSEFGAENVLAGCSLKEPSGV